MRHFAQRVGLVHELAQLRAAEELPHRGRRGLGVDQVVRHHGVDIDAAHPLPDGALHAQQAEAILVLHQLADGTHTAVAEVVDVVDLAAAVLQLAHDLHGAQHVFLAEHAHRVVGVHAEAHVHLDPADRGKVVAVGVEEQAAEQRFGRLGRRRLAGAHDAVDVDQRVVAVGVLVDGEGVADPRAIGLIDGERRQLGDPGVLEGGQPGFGQLLAGVGVDLTGVLVDQVDRHVAAQQVGAADQHGPWSSRRSSWRCGR